MRNKRQAATTAERGQWQINNTLVSLLVAIVLAILVGGVGHLFAVSQ